MINLHESNRNAISSANTANCEFDPIKSMNYNVKVEHCLLLPGREHPSCLEDLEVHYPGVVGWLEFEYPDER